MRARSAFKTALALCIGATFLLLAGYAPGRGSGVSLSDGHVPNAQAPVPAAAAGGVRDLGPMRRGTASLLLRMRDPKEVRLATDVARLYSGTSSRYGDFISPRQFQRRYGPAASDIKAISRALSAFGLHVSSRGGSPWIAASGPVATVDTVFHAAIERYQLADGRRFIAGRHNPRVPGSLRRLVAEVARPSTVPPTRVRASGTGLSPADIVKAYNIGPLLTLGVDGAGQTVVFIEVDGVDTVALSAFAHRFGLPPFRIQSYGPALKAGDEATMDLEVVHAIAPKAGLVVYNFPQGILSADGFQRLSSVISASAGDIISESLALCERYASQAGAQALQSAYARADVAGEAAFVSSGDSGAYGCISPADRAPTPPAIAAMLPAACPGVTAVGGTKVNVLGDGARSDETAWEDPLETLGSGGGPSSYFVRPAWQRAPGVVAQAHHYGALERRLEPDIAADADPASGMTIAFPGSNGSPTWSTGGGTSQAAPIWAAITALIDQYLEVHHHGVIGWMNPALYSLARTHQAKPPFHDVVIGSNLAFAAGRGYDMATGLGTPDVWNLAQDLATFQSSHGR